LSIVHSSALITDSVSGMLSTKVVPRSSVVSISISPFTDFIMLITTSMPTPRPEMPVTVSAVEKPGLKIRLSFAVLSMHAASASVITPLLMAEAASLSGSMPRPSSRTSMRMLLPMR